MNKLLVFSLLGVLLIGCVYALDVRYSDPTYSDGHKIEWKDSINERPIKQDISKEEWNNIFEDYRSGEISKEDAIKIIKGVDIKW